MNGRDKKLSFMVKVQQLMEPILLKLETIESKVSKSSTSSKPRYYRNEDLKQLFGISNNTIIKYRQLGILPYTKLGDIFLYEVQKIEKILNDNMIR